MNLSFTYISYKKAYELNFWLIKLSSREEFPQTFDGKAVDIIPAESQSCDGNVNNS